MSQPESYVTLRGGPAGRAADLRRECPGGRPVTRLAEGSSSILRWFAPFYSSQLSFTIFTVFDRSRKFRSLLYGAWFHEEDFPDVTIEILEPVPMVLRFFFAFFVN